jgi:hypothetical protein
MSGEIAEFDGECEDLRWVVLMIFNVQTKAGFMLTSTERRDHERTGGNQG